MSSPPIILGPLDYKAALEEQICTYHRRDSQLTGFLKAPDGWQIIGECLDFVYPPVEDCFQTLFIELPMPGATRMLALELLEKCGKLGNLPLPCDWTTLEAAANYRSGLHVTDICLQVEERVTPGDIRSRLVAPNLTTGGRWANFGASDAIVAIALKGSDMFPLMTDLNAYQVVIPGLNILSQSDRGASLIPSIGWDLDGHRQPLDAIWSHQEVRRCAVPIVRNVQTLQEILKRKEKASESR